VEGNKEHNFYFTSEDQAEPYGRGLYELRLEMTDGATVEGWFVVSGPGPGSVPAVLSPFSGEAFRTKNPPLRWTNYFSEYYRPFERRRGYARILRVQPDGRVGRSEDRWGFTWGIELAPPYVTAISAGQKGRAGGSKERREEMEGYGEKELVDGSYELRVGFQETRELGPIRLGRESVRVVPFSVWAR
jgi:hypothetical protein